MQDTKEFDLQFDLNQAHNEGVVAAFNYIRRVTDHISPLSTDERLELLSTFMSDAMQSGYPTTDHPKYEALEGIRELINTRSTT